MCLLHDRATTTYPWICSELLFRLKRKYLSSIDAVRGATFGPVLLAVDLKDSDRAQPAGTHVMSLFFKRDIMKQLSTVPLTTISVCASIG
jgi:hypothetical protein